MRRRDPRHDGSGALALLAACFAVMGAAVVYVSTHDLVPGLPQAASCVAGAGILATSLLGMLTL